MANFQGDLGLRVSQARNRAGMTQEALASASGIPRSAIAKIELGLRRVGAVELVDLAGALGQRVEWLLTDAPAAVVAHRTRLDPELNVATIDKELERIARDARLVFELHPGLVPVEVPRQEIPASNKDAEALAKRARKLAGLKDSEVVEDTSVTASRLGLFAFSAPLGPETADAASTRVGAGGVALVNSTNAVGRRRLALAHELGHFLIRDDYTVDWRIAEHAASDRTETLLDRFARAFLLPDKALGRQWVEVRDEHSVRTSAVIIASRFHVDMSTLASRLRELNIAGVDETNSIYGVKTGKADITGYDLKVTYEMEGRTVAPAYAKAILEAYLKERISADRATDLLYGTFDFAELPERGVRHADEIWSLFS